MLAKMTSLESKHIELDGKVSNLLDVTHENSQALVDIKSMFSKFLGKLKDQTNPHSKPKPTCEEQQPSPHDVTMIPKEMFPMHDVDPLDTSVGGSGMK